MGAAEFFTLHDKALIEKVRLLSANTQEQDEFKKCLQEGYECCFTRENNESSHIQSQIRA